MTNKHAPFPALLTEQQTRIGRTLYKDCARRDWGPVIFIKRFFEATGVFDSRVNTLWNALEAEHAEAEKVGDLLG